MSDARKNLLSFFFQFFQALDVARPGKDIDSGSIQHWNTLPAPGVAIRYWKLSNDATMRDVILAIRADEAHHRVVNHNLASLKKDQFNPFKPGQ